MRRYIVWLAIAGTLGGRLVFAQSTATVILFHNARVFDGERAVNRQDVLVRGDRISAVGTSLAAPAGAAVVEATGMTLVPGLIDAHTHTTSSWVPRQALMFGVTT